MSTHLSIGRLVTRTAADTTAAATAPTTVAGRIGASIGVAVVSAVTVTAGVAAVATVTAPPAIVEATLDQDAQQIAPVAAAGGVTYYVSPQGADTNNGTSPARAFRTLGRASSQTLRPGDQLLLARGAAFRSQTLRVDGSGTATAPIHVGSYGAGTLPTITADADCVRITGDHVTVTAIHPTDCTWVGLRLSGAHDTAYGVTASHNEVGIEADPTSRHAKILRNQLLANDRMAPGTPGTDDDYGAHGILVRGDDAEVAWNHITDSVAVSPDYGTDGTAIEIYGGIGTDVHHNVAQDNRAFTELGNSRSADTTYAYNISISDVPYAEFIVTRGADPTHGGVQGTVVTHNTVKHTGRGSQAFWCGYNCSPRVLTLTNNIFDIEGRIGYADGTIGGHHNLYTGSELETPLLPGDIEAAPRFVATAANDLHLAPTSPAIDRAQGTAGHTHDLDNRSLPRDGDHDGTTTPDLGALER